MVSYSLQPIVALTETGQFLRSWGAAHIAKGTEFGDHGLHVDGKFVWVTDVTNHTINKFDGNGTLIRRVGTPGIAGSGTNPLQFGNVADMAFGEHLTYVSDGDGGINNRFAALDAQTLKTMWTVGKAGSQPGEFRWDTDRSCT